MPYKRVHEGWLHWFFQPALLPRLIGLFCFGGLYYLAYALGFAFSQGRASPFWFPDAILLCALLSVRPRNWWVFILATLPIRVFSRVSQDVPSWFLLATFAIDSAKGLTVAALLRRFLKNPLRMETLREFGIFCVVAALLGPAMSAFFGAAALQGIGRDYWSAWQQWFMGDALVQLVLTPAILCCVFGSWQELKRPFRNKSVEASLLTVGLIAACWLEFGMSMSAMSFSEVCFYCPVPLLFWAAIRFGMLGASGGVFMISLFAVDAAIRGRPPFFGEAPADVALSLQEFLLVRAAPLYLVAILIQQKENVERSLRESEERFRNLADTAPVMIWTTGVDKSCDFVNRGWLEFTGRTLEQEIGDSWQESIHPEDVRQNVEIYYTAFEARLPFMMEYRLRRHDGEYRWVLDRGVPRYDPSGEFLGYVGTVIDLTDRKRAEEARQNLVHASRLAVLGEFTGMIAHELNQPLSAILTNTDAIKAVLELHQIPIDELGEILADIRRDDLRATEAINRIRALVKKREMNLQPVNINEAVSGVLRLAMGDALRRGVQIREDYCKPPPVVQGDIVHLQQVMLNLIMNGMDAMEGVPRPERRLSVSSVRHEDGMVEVAVRDSGQGIPAENLSKVFNSFFTTKEHGVGIGLSMARSIIQMHGGRLWAENNSDRRGTTFHFTVPAIATPLPARQSKRRESLAETR